MGHASFGLSALAWDTPVCVCVAAQGNPFLSGTEDCPRSFPRLWQRGKVDTISFLVNKAVDKEWTIRHSQWFDWLNRKVLIGNHLCWTRSGYPTYTNCPLPIRLDEIVSSLPRCHALGNERLDEPIGELSVKDEPKENCYQRRTNGGDKDNNPATFIASQGMLAAVGRRQVAGFRLRKSE